MKGIALAAALGATIAAAGAQKAGSMNLTLTAVDGIKVGHFTLAERPTGCTVVLAKDGTTGSVDVRGGAPGTRETDLLNPVNDVQIVNAIVLSGGSAFGLDAASGTMKWLDERHIGYPVGTAGVVPIVPSAILFDLGFGGDPKIRPGPDCGYRAADGDGPGAPAGERRYRLLAEMLASMIAGVLPDPAATAEQAGREWGSYLAEQPPPYQPPTAARALGDLTALLDDMGFDPEVADPETRLRTPPRILLHECPFREVASRHPAVVCSLHLGVIRGALARMRAPLTAGRLEPFASPGLCLVHLTHLGEDGAGEQDGEGVAGAAASGR